ncbi:cysteine desulfurase [Malaciobacter molluscorum]|uniref:cysteine desulfurase n=1 Tax=Malaciobacter molluscorum TaxID=1032072 RepID=UPI00100B18C8|nr:cysteine desulfurase [Malaciobacter molluscorum]RXJ96514.1 cysteine desulfurase [Malaciobacter molluscorum]
MFKLNFLLYPNVQDLHISNDYSLNVLDNNEVFNLLKKDFLKKYNFKDLKTIEFSKFGILGFMIELNGKIAVSKGESQSIVDGAIEYEKLGFEVLWLDLNKDGSVKLDLLEKNEIDFIFISSYVMDTFVKTDLQKVKSLTSAKVISNSSANFDENCDIAIFDCYKLSGYTSNAVVLHNNEFDEQNLANIDALSIYLCFESLKNQTFNTSNKKLFLEELKKQFNDDIYFFVEPNSTLEYSLHFALKNIKARELIRTSALSNIHITNGEGCSLGLSKPSRIIQHIQYDETTSRNAISLSFCEEYKKEQIEKVVQILHKKYRQIRVLNEQ